MCELGEVYVVAPESEQSGASHSLTLARPLRIRQIDERHWTVDAANSSSRNHLAVRPCRTGQEGAPIKWRPLGRVSAG